MQCAAESKKIIIFCYRLNTLTYHIPVITLLIDIIVELQKYVQLLPVGILVKSAAYQGHAIGIIGKPFNINGDIMVFGITPHSAKIN